MDVEETTSRKNSEEKLESAMQEDEDEDEDEDPAIKQLKHSRKIAARKVTCHLKLIPKDTSVRVGGKAINLKTIGAKAFLHNKVEELTVTVKGCFGARVNNLSCKLYEGEKELDGDRPLLFNAIMKGFTGFTKDNKALANGEEINIELYYLLQ